MSVSSFELGYLLSALKVESFSRFLPYLSRISRWKEFSAEYSIENCLYNFQNSSKFVLLSKIKAISKNRQKNPIQNVFQKKTVIFVEKMHLCDKNISPFCAKTEISHCDPGENAMKNDNIMALYS